MKNIVLFGRCAFTVGVLLFMTSGIATLVLYTMSNEWQQKCESGHGDTCLIDQVATGSEICYGQNDHPFTGYYMMYRIASSEKATREYALRCSRKHIELDDYKTQ